jgi:glycosyltransferase involved in cell wall biosynthesis
MRISFCIPQYNRIKFLLKNLRTLEQQTYDDIEIVISDDASTDGTQGEIEELQKNYRFPLVYKRFPKNVGYDANLRSSLEMASGKYCFILGNDDTIERPDAISDLVKFLQENNEPEIGFCNYVEAHSPEKVIARANITGIVGSGEDIALKYYRSFSFVAGIIIRNDVFRRVNTDKVDGSVYVQMYMAALIITSGGRLFMYAEPMVTKDIQIEGSMANSYRDTLMKTWKDYKPIDGGLKQVIAAVSQAFQDSGSDMNAITYKILDNIYKFTYPYWLFDYRSNGSYIGAIAMMQGLKPGAVPSFSLLTWDRKLRIRARYMFSSLIGLTMPVFLFNNLKLKIYKYIKR